MKKIILILIIFNALLFAKDIDKYLNYSNQLLNYQFQLKGFNSIKPPFEPEVNIINGKKVTNLKKLIKTIKVNLLSIFDKKAYVLIKIYLGNQFIKSYRKWVSVDDKIGDCKVSSIYFEKLILKCKNKTLIKSLNKKIPQIKEIQ